MELSAATGVETEGQGCPRLRLERDLLGERELPAGALYGVHTLRAAENFPLSLRPVHPELVTALALVKKACARANAALGYLSPEVALAITQAADELAAGQWREAVLTDALQGGAGTSANMNVNEILANRAAILLGGAPGDHGLVHPIGHVNLHQSTNDVFPTALKIATIRLLGRLEPAIAALQAAFQAKEAEFSRVVKMGRTELQDACPVTMGAAFSAFAEALSRDRWRVFKCTERLRVVNLGGTAVGTGLTAPRRYIFLAVEKLREETGLGLARAENLMDATQNADAFVEVSGILKAHAVNLLKISSDLRLMASGPAAGLGEIVLPAVQAGSSLMPGKVNPVICEAAGQAAMLAMAQDQAVTLAALHGQLELNAFLPLLAQALLESLDLLTRADTIFRERCVAGIAADAAACARQVDASWATIAALVPHIGYDAATEAARRVRESGLGVRRVIADMGLMDAQSLERLLAPEAMTRLGHGRET